MKIGSYSDKNPDVAEALFHLGNIRRNQGDLNKAEEFYIEARMNDPHLSIPQDIQERINERNKNIVSKENGDTSSTESSKNVSDQREKPPIGPIIIHDVKLEKPSETTPGYNDNPVVEKYNDLLGSSDFAQYLAKRIIQIYDENRYDPHIPQEKGQFVMVHVFGAWGSGKTTFLNFLKKAFESEIFIDRTTEDPKRQKQKWSIVWFNAWREQHRSPPWWALMDTIFQGNKKYIKRRHRFSEYLSRMKSEKFFYFIAITGTLAAIAAISLILQFTHQFSPDSTQLTSNQTALGIFAEGVFFH